MGQQRTLGQTEDGIGRGYADFTDAPYAAGGSSNRRDEEGAVMGGAFVPFFAVCTASCSSENDASGRDDERHKVPLYSLYNDEAAEESGEGVSLSSLLPVFVRVLTALLLILE